MPKQYKGAVVVVKNNRVMEVALFLDLEQAREIFMGYCRNYLSNFDEYSSADIDTIFEAGEELIGDIGCISIYWF